MKKNILKIFSILSIIILIAGLYFYMTFWLPHSKLSNLEWQSKASPKEMRKLAHQILDLPFSNTHDACLILITYGNRESIPYLLNGLKKFKDYNENGDNFIECTHDHCVEALKKITKKDCGYRYQAWLKELEKK